MIDNFYNTSLLSVLKGQVQQIDVFKRHFIRIIVLGKVFFTTS